MPVIGKHRCGCDCKNPTIAADQSQWNMCCQRDALNGTPAKYGVAFECEHDWPLYEYFRWAPDYKGPAFWPVGVNPGIDSTCDGPKVLRVPEDCRMTYPVLELKKDCLLDTVAYSPAGYNLTACSYSNAIYAIGGDSFGSGCLLHSVFDSRLTEVNNPAERGRLFPPYKTYVPPDLEYVEGDYYRDSARTHIEWWNGPVENWVNPVAVDWSHLWHLDLSGSEATLEWVNDFVLNQMDGGAGKPRPRYVQEKATWELWGRNTMVLTNPSDWPGLKRKICVFAIGKPKLSNPCITHAQRCLCCDTGGDRGILYVTATGCSQLPWSGAVPIRRVYPGYTGTGTGEQYEVPCGVVAPEGVCGFFWGVFNPDPDRPPCPPPTGTGSGGGHNYTGNIGIALYCTGSGTGPTGGPPYLVDLYCEYDDGAGICYDGPFAADVTHTACSCTGVILAFTFAQLPCCCTGIDTDCCNATPTTMTASITNVSGCGCLSPSTYTMNYDGIVGGSHQWSSTDAGSATDLCGNLIGGVTSTLTLRCESGSWYLQVECAALANPATTSSCSPFELTFTGFSLTGCCGGSAATVDIVITG